MKAILEESRGQLKEAEVVESVKEVPKRKQRQSGGETPKSSSSTNGQRKKRSGAQDFDQECAQEITTQADVISSTQ